MRNDIVFTKDIISMEHSSTRASQKQLPCDAVRESIYIMQSRCKLIPLDIYLLWVSAWISNRECVRFREWQPWYLEPECS